jgi:hydrogenase maturation protease
VKTHTLILGIGNPLMADDGAGVQVIELLRQESLPAGVRVQDGGTAGVGLVPEMEGHERLILVDCATMGDQNDQDSRRLPVPAGEWRRFTLEETRLLAQEGSALSLHNANLQDALRLAEALGVLPPETIIYGIQPETVEWDQPMSVSVSAALPAVAQAILNELNVTN